MHMLMIDKFLLYMINYFTSFPVLNFHVRNVF